MSTWGAVTANVVWATSLTIASVPSWALARAAQVPPPLTGIGKTYLACALAQKACREGYTALYNRLPRLFEQLAMAKGDGLYGKLLDKIAKSDLLVLHDWGLSVLTESQRKDLLELIEDRSNLRSTIIATQLPVAKWHEVINDQTIADAILDRLVHNAHKINMEGDSMRKKINKVPTSC